MVSTGDRAPDIQASIMKDEVEEFALEDYLGDGPVVLAFFPGAFTPPCSNEMAALEDHYGDFEAAGGTLLGVSADSPFAQQAFRAEYGLEFELVSDTEGDAIEAFDLEIDIPSIGLHDVANRAVYVLDSEGTVTYAWVAEEPGNEPDYDELLQAVEDAA